MTGTTRTIADINRHLRSGEAVAWTVSDLVADGRANVPADQVDVVTVAFGSSLSGTTAMLVVPVAGRGVFTRAEKIWLNGVKGTPGPAPNERLGVVDTMVMADDHREADDSGYDGAALLHDILTGRRIEVECEAVEGSHHSASVTLADLEFARLYVYNAFLDSPLPDPALATLGRGSRVLLNGAQGIIVGDGTRSSTSRHAWSVAADMFKMDPGLMTGLEGIDRSGVGNLIAVAIPVLDQAVLQSLAEWAASYAPVGPRDVAARQLRDMLADGNFTLTDTDVAI